jgi:AraC-like DNA-binding protein
MPGSGTFSFSNTDDYQAGFSDVFASFILSCAVVFAGQTARAVLDHMALLRARESAARVAYVVLPPDTVFVSFSCDPTLPLIWGGQALGPDELMLHACGERLHQRTLGPSCWGMVSLRPASLAGYAKAMTGSALGAPESGRILKPSRRDRKLLLRIDAEAARLAGTRPQTLAHPQIIRSMEQELAEVLVDCLTRCKERTESGIVRQRAKRMAHFEYVLAEIDPREWRPQRLAEVIGVSERTLQKDCAATLGCSPTGYLLMRRLRQARSAIVGADPKGAVIGDLARAAGFASAGRFAASYRTAFGETPSTTLRRLAIL